MVRQEHDWSCGPACVRQLLLDQGVDVAEAVLCDRTDYAEGWGTSAPSLAQVLSEITGKTYRGGSVDPLVLERLLHKVPFLAQLSRSNGDHWVIVIGSDELEVNVLDPWGLPDVDPTCGLEGWIARDLFDAYWSGAAHQVVFCR